MKGEGEDIANTMAAGQAVAADSGESIILYHLSDNNIQLRNRRSNSV